MAIQQRISSHNYVVFQSDYFAPIDREFEVRRLHFSTHGTENHCVYLNFRTVYCKISMQMVTNLAAH